MRTKLKKFINILVVEFLDLIEDIEMIRNTSIERLKQHEITEYVYLENSELLQEEIQSIRTFVRYLNELDVSGITGYDDLLESINQYLDRKVRDAGFPPLMKSLFEKKSQKVLKFVNKEDVR